MNLALLAACCSLVVFALANAVASAWLLWHWRARRERWMHLSASGLLFRRALPAIVSVALAVLTVLPAFLTHEPRDRVEAVSLPLAIGAAFGVLIVAAGALRGIEAVRRTRLAVRRWLPAATPVRLPGWPGAAWLVESSMAGISVVGLRRPTLLVARGVLAACTPAELAGIVAHERAHAARRDAWKLLVLCCLPDLVGLTPIASRIERVWRARTEEEADRAASRGDRTLGVEIAGALVKLARQRLPPGLPMAVAFDAGGAIERRVRLLLAGASSSPSERRRRGGLRLGLAVLLPAVAFGALPPLSIRVHAMVETLVRLLA